MSETITKIECDCCGGDLYQQILQLDGEKAAKEFLEDYKRNPSKINLCYSCGMWLDSRERQYDDEPDDILHYVIVGGMVDNYLPKGFKMSDKATAEIKDWIKHEHDNYKIEECKTCRHIEEYKEYKIVDVLNIMTRAFIAGYKAGKSEK
jgi:hypothetical protein